MRSAILICTLLPFQILAVPQPRRNLRSRADIKPSLERAEAVKEAFRFAWNGYYKYAFPNDELRPVSNTFGNSRNGWGASAVDALTTAIVMEEKAIVNQILEYVPRINWDDGKGIVSLFETTIRYLGGLISGYDFLNARGPLKHLANNQTNVEQLIWKAMYLANKLRYAFNTRTGVPYNELVFPDKVVYSATNGLATIGTLVLEWTRLSDITGTTDYATRAQRAEAYLLNPYPKKHEPFPGLVGTDVFIDNGTFRDGYVSWSGGADSFYEYLIKMYVYDPKRFSNYKDRWVLAADSSIKHLASHPATRPDLTFMAQFDQINLVPYSQHLTCFDGGSFLLGGSVLGRQDYIDFGLKLVESCHETYKSTATGIGPEAFSWDPDRVPENQRDFYNKNRFWITNSYYVLRPEVIESIYHAYRITGDPRYQQWAWDTFLRINKTCRSNSGFSEISNVNDPSGGLKTDNQESFFFAEVLKYLYLIFAPDAPWQVATGGQKNKWVFNTEAHPFKIFGS